MRRADWEWRIAAGTLHAAPISDSYLPCPGDEIRCICGAEIMLRREDFPRSPSCVPSCRECWDLVAS